MLSGLTIAHRFALGAPSGWHVPGATSWTAHDTRLDAPVIVVVADSDGADETDGALAALTRVRGIRDPRLARIVDVGIADVPDSDDAATDVRRAYAAIAIPPDPTVAAILDSRILPAALARLLVRGVSEALDAASAGGLAHGALSADAVGVTRRGRVIVAGAGILAAFGGDAHEAEASNVQELATIFVRALLGSDLDVADDSTLSKELTRSERRLVHRAVRGRFPTSVAALLADLGPTEGATLSAIRTQLRTLERVVPPAPEEPEVAALPAGAVREAIDEWELERLLEEQEAAELPTVTEAILDLLHRRFPRSSRITSFLESAHARALRRPRVSGTLWTVLSLLLLIAVLTNVAMNIFRAPYVPNIDLKNPPPQTYPTFTFSPSPTSVSPTP